MIFPLVLEKKESARSMPSLAPTHGRSMFDERCGNGRGLGNRTKAPAVKCGLKFALLEGVWTFSPTRGSYKPPASVEASSLPPHPRPTRQRGA